MVPIDSTRMTSYLTSIDPSIVSVTIFEILTCNFNDLEPELFKIIQVKDHGVNRKLIHGFLSDLHCV